jgi:hypothetical protein
MKMANELTRKMVDSTIAELLLKTGKVKICTACNGRNKKGLHIPILCTAHKLDQALADYERAGDRLSELYFEAKSEILK